MSQTFPLIEVSGTHKDIGHAIGETFKTKIQDVINQKRTIIAEYDRVLSTIDSFIRITEKSFPQLIEELTAVADAADVPFKELFFRNIGALTDPETAMSREESETVDHCTTVVSWESAGHPIVGHNEDWDIKSIDELYILKAKLPHSSFISLNYATFLPGVSAGMNSHGIVQCINEIPQTRINGVPKNFIARAMLECKTLTQCERVVRQTKHSSGYNHVLLQGNNGRDLEIGGRAVDIQSFDYLPYVHTNHYLSNHLKQYEIHSQSHQENSHTRYTRVHELLRLPMDFSDMQAILSDHSNEKYPICRHKETIASIIIQPSEQVFHVCYGLPCTGTYVPYRL